MARREALLGAGYLGLGAGAALALEALMALGVFSTVVSAAASATDTRARPNTVYVWMTHRPPDVGLSTVRLKGPKTATLPAGPYTVYAAEPDQGHSSDSEGPA